MKFESSSAISKGLGNALEIISEVGSLPFIRGTWFYVDPTSGANTSDGRTIDTAVADLSTAYGKCTSGAGDGIVLMSRGTGTSSQTTSYLTAELAWSKHGITVVGAGAPITMYNRARVANKKITTGSIETISFTADHTITDSAGGFLTAGFAAGQKIDVNTTSNTNDGQYTILSVTATTITTTTGSSHVSTEDAATAGATVITSYNVNLMTVSGSNNTFKNVSFWNGGDNALEIGGIVVTGHRNYFERCHITGGAGAAAAATKYSLKIDAGQDNQFRDCTIGSDTFDHGNNADVELILNGVVARNKFFGCEFVSFVNSGTAHGAVKSVSTSGGSPTLFKNCVFNSMLSSTTPAAAFLSSGDVDKIGAPGSVLLQFAAWGAGVYVEGAASAASAGGRIATKS